jgi:predicted acetyltransferase
VLGENKMSSANNRVNSHNIEMPLLREAIERDIPQLGIHHRKMVEEIWEKKHKSIDMSIGKKLEIAYVQKLKQELVNGVCKVWVIETEGKIIASGAITIFRYVPTPDNIAGSLAYFHSVYTEMEHRNNGYASSIIAKATQYCIDNEIKRIMLNASEAGRPIYEKYGFQSAPEAMRLVIE